MNITSKSGFSIVNDTRTLKALAKANLIKWPVLVNWPESKKPYPRYVDEVDNIGMRFEYKGNKYELRYHSGCFFPYLYITY